MSICHFVCFLESEAPFHIWGVCLYKWVEMKEARQILALLNSGSCCIDMVGDEILQPDLHLIN